MDPVMLEWAYAREVMRCLGFLPDELFFAIHNPEGVILNGELIKTDETVVSLILRTQNKSFTWTIGTTKLSPADARTAYEELCSNWNDGEEWSLNGFRASEAFQQKIALISALQDRGFLLNPRAS